MEMELVKAIPGGGQLVVFLITVVIFLRQMQVITQSFQAQITSLTESVFRVSVDTSKALTELAAAVRALQIKVDESNSHPIPPR